MQASNHGKSKYHKSQRVFVKPVGTGTHVEAVVTKMGEGLRGAVLTEITD